MKSQKAYNIAFNTVKNTTEIGNFFGNRRWIAKALNRIEESNIKFIVDEHMLDKYDVLKKLEYNIKHKNRNRMDIQKYANLIGGREKSKAEI